MVKVSVVIPTYNRANTLQRTINSVLDQTFNDIEIIIIDDGSTDNTKEIVEKYDKEFINYIYQKNSGANAARNRGIREAEGDLISFLDSDDELRPAYLEVTLEALQSVPKTCGGAFTSFYVYRNGKKDTISVAPNRIIRYKDIIRTNIIGSFSCTTFRDDVFSKVGMLDEKLQASQDYDFYIRVLEEYDMVGIDQPLVNYYTSKDAISQDINRKLQAQKRILQKHGEKLTPKRKSEYHYMNGFLYGKRKDMTASSSEFKKGIKIYPWNPIYYYHYFFSYLGPMAFSKSLKFKKIITGIKYSIRNIK